MLVLLLGLHDLHDLGVDDELAFLGDLGHLGLASLDLLLHALHGDQGHADGLVREVRVQSKLLSVRLELRVLVLFDQQFYLRVRHRKKSSIELLLRNLGLFLNLSISELVVPSLVIHIQDSGLEHINYKLVSFLEAPRVQLHISVLIKPLQLAVRVLVPVEFFEADFEHREA